MERKSIDRAKVLGLTAAFLAALIAGWVFDVKAARYAADFYAVFRLLAAPMLFRDATLQWLAATKDIFPKWLSISVDGALVVFMAWIGANQAAMAYGTSLLIVMMARNRANTMAKNDAWATGESLPALSRQAKRWNERKADLSTRAKDK